MHQQSSFHIKLTTQESSVNNAQTSSDQMVGKHTNIFNTTETLLILRLHHQKIYNACLPLEVF